MRDYSFSVFKSISFVLLLSISYAQDKTIFPTFKHGKLQVLGTQLCNSKGKPIQLKGMSSHGLQWYGLDDCLTDKSLDILAYRWKSDMLRLSMYYNEDGYKSDPKRFRTIVDTLIDETLKRGMYCMIDWHILTPGNPMDMIEDAKEFFSYMSKKHGHKKHILYEICNEPNGKDVTWSTIKAYAEEIIPIIRANDKDGIILVGTPDWASFGISGPKVSKEILMNPLTSSFAHNIMYSFHFYAASHKEYYREQFSTFLEKLPIFVTEWGSQNESGEGYNDIISSEAWLRILDKYKISWCNWNYSDDKRSGAVWKDGTCVTGKFTESELKDSGQLVKQWIQTER